jgi:uncharacterized phage-like protein YoqJ
MIKNLPQVQKRVVILSESHKIAYPTIAKAASSSIKEYIIKNTDGKQIIFDREISPLWHEDFKDYFCFSFVRHPIDRLFSCYKNKIKRPTILDWKTDVDITFREYGSMFYRDMSFKDFLKVIIPLEPYQQNAHFRCQYQYLCDKDENIIVDFIGKFENLENDFNYIVNKNNLPKKRLPCLNKVIYYEEYDEEAIELAKCVFGVKKDMEIFNYE